MKIINVQDIDSIESVRPKTSNDVRKRVLSIISDARRREDKALREYEAKFSGAKLRS